MLMSKDYARELNANIIIFIKQAQLINSLYSYGYDGPGPRIGSRLINLGGPRLAPRLAPKTWPADRRPDASGGQLLARRRGGGCRRPGISPGFTGSNGRPQGSLVGNRGGFRASIVWKAWCGRKIGFLSRPIQVKSMQQRRCPDGKAPAFFGPASG